MDGETSHSLVHVIESKARSTRYWMCYQTLFSKKAKNCFVQEWELWLSLCSRFYWGTWKEIGVGWVCKHQLTSCWRGRHVVNILHWVENESRKRAAPSGVCMPIYPFVAADHFNGVLGQARKARCVVCICQFLWTVRWLNVWLFHYIFGIMHGKEY